jgi:cell division transport system permease protein
LIEEVNSKLTISLYLKDNLSENSLETIEFLKDLQNVSPTISAEFNSKEQVLADLEQRDAELVKILERDNPLPPTITITGVSLSEYEAINDIISTRSVLLLENPWDKDNALVTASWSIDEGKILDFWLEINESEIVEENVYSYKNQYERINQVTFILSSLQYGLYFIISIFLLSIGVIVYSVIGNFVYYYRNEIYITKLVWGSNIFIYWPFSLQGLMYVLLAFALSIIWFFIVFDNASFAIGEDTAAFTQYIFNENFSQVLLMELAVFSFLWLFSGFLSSKKYLKNND